MSEKFKLREMTIDDYYENVDLYLFLFRLF